MTMSTAPVNLAKSSRCNRTASRVRRRSRFRSTEPPRAFPTVNPTLTGLSLSDRARSRKNTVRLPEKWRLPSSYTRRKSACFSRCTDLGNLALEAPLTVAPVRLHKIPRGSTSSDIPTRNHHLTRPRDQGGFVATKASRDNPASQKLACAPWRDDAKEPPDRSWSSCGCGNRASWHVCGGWVGMCAWAWKNGAPLIGKLGVKQMKSIKERTDDQQTRG